MRQVTDRAMVTRWLAGYEAAWRTPGTAGLSALFSTDATYLKSPYEPPVTGLAAIGRMWEDERESAGEVFTLTTEILAVDGPVAVVRAEVRYGDPPRQEYRDLWVIRFAGDGRCTWFEEWPYWPGRPYAAGDDPAAEPADGADAGPGSAVTGDDVQRRGPVRTSGGVVGQRRGPG